MKDAKKCADSLACKEHLKIKPCTFVISLNGKSTIKMKKCL